MEGENKATLTYRNATLEDLETIVEIYNSTVASRLVTADTEPVSVASKVKWFEEHSPDKRPLWMIADETGAIMGWASFQSFYGRPAYSGTVEVSIYLAEQQRGKSYGRQILEHCISSAPQFAIKTLLGFIFAHNEPSLKLFRNLGFQDWAHLPNVAELDGVERSLIIVGRRV